MSAEIPRGVTGQCVPPSVESAIEYLRTERVDPGQDRGSDPRSSYVRLRGHFTVQDLVGDSAPDVVVGSNAPPPPPLPFPEGSERSWLERDPYGLVRDTRFDPKLVRLEHTLPVHRE